MPSNAMTDDHPDHRPAGRPADATRRGVLRAAAAVGVAAVGGVGLAGRALGRGGDGAGSGGSGAGPSVGRAKGKARNVVFMVSDGMSAGTLQIADSWARRHLGRPGAWPSLWGSPGVRRATVRTHSADGLVTDSAAGGTAWGCGVHVNNGAINVTPEGAQTLPILVRARQAGKRTGVVTTARVTHATPASFYANSPLRDYEGLIASELLERGIDVALGGGARFFPKELLDKHPGVRVVRTAGELAAAAAEGKDGRLLGLFHQHHVAHVLDRGPETPSLPAMTRVALERLSAAPEGFVLQVEGGRIDHAAHNNDAGSLLHEQLEFDECVGLVAAWARERGDTLVVVTTDHGNANPGLTLYGRDGDRAFERLAGAARSFEWVHDRMAPLKSAQARAEAFPAYAREATGQDLSAAELAPALACLRGEGVMPFGEMNKWTSVLGATLAGRWGVAFASPNHTADYVECTALGPGSEPVGGLMDNVDLHGVMVEALGLPPGELTPEMREPMKVEKPVKPD